MIKGAGKNIVGVGVMAILAPLIIVLALCATLYERNKG
jgi:hypothetical protein